MNNKKDLQDLEQIFMSGDSWLRKYGVVSAIQHNSIVMNLYVHFPKVRYVEYLMPEVPEDRRIHVILHFKFFDLLFKNKEKLIEQVIELLREYLYDYDITVELKRYHKGVETKNEKTSSNNTLKSDLVTSDS